MFLSSVHRPWSPEWDWRRKRIDWMALLDPLTTAAPFRRCRSVWVLSAVSDWEIYDTRTLMSCMLLQPARLAWRFLQMPNQSHRLESMALRLTKGGNNTWISFSLREENCLHYSEENIKSWWTRFDISYVSRLITWSVVQHTHTNKIEIVDQQHWLLCHSCILL